MQVIDWHDNVSELLTGKFEDIAKRMQELEGKPGIKEIKIGNLPRFGEIIEIHNLKFKVKAELSRNRFVIQLLGRE